MRLYPELAGPRNRQITRDVLVLLVLMLFACFAWAVRKAVMALTAISAGFTGNAQQAEDTWSSVGDSLSGIPLLGDDIQDSLQRLSEATVGSAIAAGQAITDAVTTAANVLALVTFAAPAAVVLVLWLPRRLDRSRTWTAADQVLSAIPVGRFGAVSGAAPNPRIGPRPDGPRARPVAVASSPDALLALRALCGLPLVELARWAPHPFEAYAAGDYAPLIRALYEYEGLKPPG